MTGRRMQRAEIMAAPSVPADRRSDQDGRTRGNPELSTVTTRSPGERPLAMTARSPFLARDANKRQSRSA